MQPADAIEVMLLVAIIGLLVRGKDTRLMQGRERKVLLDSCGLIDGRIVELVKAGFMPGRIIVADFTIKELQMIADGKDEHKRERARMGLDTAHKLQELAAERFNLSTIDYPEIATVDDKLLRLSKQLRADLYTTDVALAKVAAIQKTPSMNINELLSALRPAVLPGETLDIKLIQKGNSPDQAIGYREDGSMVVVDKAARHIGKTVTVICERMHQTVAGKMLFATLSDQQKSEPRGVKRKFRLVSSK